MANTDSRTSAGASALSMAKKLDRGERPARLLKTVLVALPVGVLLAYAFGVWVGVGLGGVLALLAWRLLSRRGAGSSWRKGARGERLTARRLDPLRRRGLVVLHDLSIPGSKANLDHVVIGRFGVVVLDSKYRTGHVRHDPLTGNISIGTTKAPRLVHSVRWEARRVSEILRSELGRPVPVRAVVVAHVPKSQFPGWRTFKYRDVAILPEEAVASWEGWEVSDETKLSSSETSIVVDTVRARFTPYE